MMVRRCGREDLVAAVEELLESAAHPPPELALRCDRALTARYVAGLRHEGGDGAVHLVCTTAGRLEGVAAVAPSPFDRQALGVATARLEGLEVRSVEAARALCGEAVAVARGLDADLVLARTSPGSPGLTALLEAGFGIYGASLLLGGPLVPRDIPRGVARAESPEDLEAAASIVREAFAGSHLARDSRIGPARAALVHERWLRTEAERGAVVLLARDEDGRPVAAAACRDNPRARRILGLELWHIHLLATRPAAAGVGHGLRTAEAAAAVAAAAGGVALQTGVDSEAVAAARIYSRLGLLPGSGSFALHLWPRAVTRAGPLPGRGGPCGCGPRSG